MTHHGNLLAPPTLLPVDPAVALLGAESAESVAAQYPASSAAWAALAAAALSSGADVTAYAYARTGYHRGLDALRRAGWRGQGLVPWSHEPNRGFLRCVYLLATAAGRIGEVAEEERCRTLLDDSDPSAAALLDAESAQ